MDAESTYGSITERRRDTTYKETIDWLKRALTKKSIVKGGTTRRVRVQEAVPSDSYVLIIGLMVLFFVGLVGLEIVHMIWMGTWNDVIFNGIMLVVGTIVGAVWGKSAE